MSKIWESIKDKLFGLKCEFYDTCNYRNSASRICAVDGGGAYCGKWRKYTNEEALKAS